MFLPVFDCCLVQKYVFGKALSVGDATKKTPSGTFCSV
jgi:hypothetical protein